MRSETLERLRLWHEMLNDEESESRRASTAAERALRQRLLHAIKHPGNKRGNWANVQQLRRRLDWHRWTQRLTDFEFRRYFRMVRTCFARLLDNIADTITSDARRGQMGSPNGAISPEMKLSMTLRWLAGGSYLDIHHFHGVCEAAFWSAKDQVLDAINACEGLDIVFPSLDDDDALKKLLSQFKEKSEMFSFDHCVGALDGLLVDLHGIKGEAASMATLYFTRKGVYVLNVQALCGTD
jgi:hypothetical protein